ncbi:MAG: thioredoxin family protein [Betaproteobacteria bacterium]|nr:thioredoxin family protein [Betaproteobacteria bacterium]
MTGEPALAQSPSTADTSLPITRDLSADAQLLRQRRIPLLVLYSQAGCPWCERARREFLLPMANDPASPGRVLLRQIDIDRDAPLKDFAGHATTHRAFARRQNVQFTPTLMFYGPDGKLLSESIVGFRLADFYGEFIERGIDEGLVQLRRKKS